MANRARGERHGRAKLTAAAVWEIRVAWSTAPRPALTALADRYGVSERTIGFVVNGLTWQHVPTPGPAAAPGPPSMEYSAVHFRVRFARGPAAAHQCACCAERCRHRPSHRIEWAQVHGTTGADPWADFLPLCCRCHRNYDGNLPSPETGGRAGAKLTAPIVLDCRRRFSAAEPVRVLAAEYGVSLATMYAAVTGRTWRNI